MIGRMEHGANGVRLLWPECDSLSLLQHPLPDRDQCCLVHRFTFFETVQCPSINTDAFGCIADTQLFMVTPCA